MDADIERRRIKRNCLHLSSDPVRDTFAFNSLKYICLGDNQNNFKPRFIEEVNS